MAAPANRLILEYIDYTGNYLRSGNWVSTSGLTAALIGAIQACSNADIAIATTENPTLGTTTPSDAVYGSVEDGMVLLFACPPGTARLFIPAPKSAIIASDGVSFDSGSVLGSALVTAVLGTLSDVNGNAATAFAQGLRTSRRRDQNG